MRLFKENKYIIFYYAVLFVLLAMRTSKNPPSELVRLAYLLAFFLPLFLKYTYFYLPCLVSFVTVSTKHFAFGYMPYENSTYAIISLVSLVAVYGLSRNSRIIINPVFLLVILYVLLVDIAYSGPPQNIAYGCITVSLGVMITKIRDGVNLVNSMLYCFIFTSLAISLIYLLNYDQFLASYNANDGMERSGWTDPNYLSCIIGTGSISALILLLRSKQARMISKLFWIVTIFLATFSQVLMASRGGLLAVSASLMVLIVFADVKKTYKALVVIFLILFVAWMYSNNYFDLLSYRIENDSDGSGRLEIWRTKLMLFAQEGNLFSWVFGLGTKNAMVLSESGTFVGFHNDFLAILCGYGLIGFITFIYLLVIYPLRKSSKNTRPLVMALVLYLVLTCMTIEPIILGQIVFVAFYAMILLLAEE